MKTGWNFTKLAEQWAKKRAAKREGGNDVGTLLIETENARRDAREAKAYPQQRAAAIASRHRKGHLADDEVADGRFWELRSCGMDPRVASVREWFFGLADKQRRKLVSLSREARHRFYPADAIYSAFGEFIEAYGSRAAGRGEDPAMRLDLMMTNEANGRAIRAHREAMTKVDERLDRELRTKAGK